MSRRSPRSGPPPAPGPPTPMQTVCGGRMCGHTGPARPACLNKSTGTLRAGVANSQGDLVRRHPPHTHRLRQQGKHGGGGADVPRATAEVADVTNMFATCLSSSEATQHRRRSVSPTASLPTLAATTPADRKRSPTPALSAYPRRNSTGPAEHIRPRGTDTTPTTTRDDRSCTAHRAASTVSEGAVSGLWGSVDLKVFPA